MSSIECGVCFRRCKIEEGGTGSCRARTVKDGKVVPDSYGRITSLALDPIEKKPLARFMPGSFVLSVGSYGCNLKCPFCQNHEISWPDRDLSYSETTPEKLAMLAEELKDRGNIGIAYTYNEPLVAYEFVRDTAKLIKEKNMKNILVTNGTAGPDVLSEILPYIDAMNIDLKGFSKGYYRDVLKGDLDTVLAFIKRASTDCHVEITTLIVPGLNDSEEEMREITAWIRENTGEDTPLHISRFFPAFDMTDRKATSVRHIYHLADIAREKLRYVYTGNC